MPQTFRLDSKNDLQNTLCIKCINCNIDSISPSNILSSLVIMFSPNDMVSVVRLILFPKFYFKLFNQSHFSHFR